METAPGATPLSLADVASQGRFKAFPHIRLLFRLFQMLVRRECLRLLISMPPQHGKSLSVAYFAAWAIMVLKWRVLVVCYDTALAKKFSRKVRGVVRRWGPVLFGCSLDPAHSSAKEWSILGHDAGLNAVGVDGDATGRSADLIIFDDLLKNFKEAMSPKIRQRAKDTISTCLESRLQDGSAIIGIATRWHQDDPSGWLLSLNEDREPEFRYTDCRLPALAYEEGEEPVGWEGDPLGRAPGEPLCPELHPKKNLLDRFVTCSSFQKAALYQQNPAPAKGHIFDRDWWNYWTLEEHDLPIEWSEEAECWTYPVKGRRFDLVIQSWDFPLKATEESTWTVGQVWGKLGNNLYLLDQFRAKVPFPEMVRAVKRMKRVWPMTGPILIELQGAGPEVIDKVETVIPGVEGVVPRFDKTVRAAVVTWLPEHGHCFLPWPGRYGRGEGKYGWVTAEGGFLEETAGFPFAEADDQVDACTQALSFFADFFGVPEDEEDEEEAPAAPLYPKPTREGPDWKKLGLGRGPGGKKRG